MPRPLASIGTSSRPLPVANDDDVPDAVQGETVTVDVLGNDVNPFPETPLRIIDVIADGNGSVSQQGSSVLVTPADSFVGNMTVQYTVPTTTDAANFPTDRYILEGLADVRYVADDPWGPEGALELDLWVVSDELEAPPAGDRRARGAFAVAENFQAILTHQLGSLIYCVENAGHR